MNDDSAVDIIESHNLINSREAAFPANSFSLLRQKTRNTASRKPYLHVCISKSQSLCIREAGTYFFVQKSTKRKIKTACA